MIARSKCVVKVYIGITYSGVANVVQFLHLHDFAHFILKANIIFPLHSLLLQKQ